MTWWPCDVGQWLDLSHDISTHFDSSDKFYVCPIIGILLRHRWYVIYNINHFGHSGTIFIISKCGNLVRHLFQLDPPSNKIYEDIWFIWPKCFCVSTWPPPTKLFSKANLGRFLVHLAKVLLCFNLTPPPATKLLSLHGFTLAVCGCLNFSHFNLLLEKFSLPNIRKTCHKWSLIVLGLLLWCLVPLSTIFSYIVAVRFIGEGNWTTWRKPPTCPKSLINFIT